jgi:hypothetical protein
MLTKECTKSFNEMLNIHEIELGSIRNKLDTKQGERNV